MIIRYLKGTFKFYLYCGSSKPIVEEYTNSDMAGDIDIQKSMSGYIFTFTRRVISWQSKLQKYIIALSTTEVEQVAIIKASKELIWIKNFLRKLLLNQRIYTLNCESSWFHFGCHRLLE